MSFPPNIPSFLQPLGDHRRTHINPSKGKKRKRKSTQQPSLKSQSGDPSGESGVQDDLPPPPPETASHILIGLNSVSRHLEALAAQHAPASSVKSSGDEEKEPGKKILDTKPSLQPLALVIIPHSHPPSSLPHTHIPTLIHLSNLNPSDTSTRLITLPPTSEARLASALHIPHVGALAIKEGTPGANALVQYAREHVGLTECAWIDEAMRGEWKATKIDDGR
jgi:ribonuclease P/MRP protein subunit POP3